MSAEADNEARYRLAAEMAGGATVAAAAIAAKLSERQAYRIKKDPSFLKMLEAAKARLAGHCGPVVSDEDGRAAKGYLLAVVDGEEAGDPNRINAAKALLAAAMGGRRPTVKAEKPTQPQEHADRPAGKVVDLAKWRNA